MRLFKKLYVTAYSSIDSVVTKLQNHDSLVAVSLQELEQKVRQAQIAYGSLTRSLQRTEEDIAKAESEEQLWTARAKKEGTEGKKDAALECLRRAHRSKQTREALGKQREISEVSHRKLQASITELQNLQKNLTLKHRELKARTEIQDAQASTSEVSGLDVSEMLSRWEDSLGIAPSAQASVDTFETNYSESEQRAALEAELQELLK
jgi:phage shock protein A